MADRAGLEPAASYRRTALSTEAAAPTQEFEYALDERFIAQRPLPRRDDSRLLVIRRAEGHLEDKNFTDIVELIAPDDVLVLNDTRVIAARLVGRKPTGAAAEVLLIRPLDDTARRWHALVRPGGKLKPGRVVRVADELEVEIEDSTEDGARVVRLDTSLPIAKALDRFGRVPLPPYIRRDDDVADRRRYQTVYAREDGSVAAPTAGLHFTEALLRRLEERGVRIARITLHVGPGTFRLVDADDLAQHRMDAEWYRITPQAAAEIGEARARRGAVWAVGTTTVRALETTTDDAGLVRAGDGWTNLFVRPGYRFRVVDRLITNFHLPRSTLLMLVAAFAGYDLTMSAYRHAVDRGYRFYSYGDATVVI